MMRITPKGIPAATAAAAPVVLPPEPRQAVGPDTTFADDARYRVRLNAIADYLGTPLSPMHVHEVSGAVATAIRDKIAAFDRI